MSVRGDLGVGVCKAASGSWGRAWLLLPIGDISSVTARPAKASVDRSMVPTPIRTAGSRFDCTELEAIPVPLDLPEALRLSKKAFTRTFVRCGTWSAEQAHSEYYVVPFGTFASDCK